MGYVCHEVRLENLGGTQFLGHQIEARINIPDLSGFRLGLQLNGKISVCYLIHGLAQLTTAL